MNHGILCWLVALLVGGAAMNLEAQGTAFYYQGRLNDAGSAANGDYDFQFSLYDAPTNGDLIAGPLKGGGNLYKLKAKGDCQLRPHLCTGPKNHGDEYTLLCGAVEKDGKLDPFNVAERAVKNREQLTPERKYDRRVEHFNFRNKD